MYKKLKEKKTREGKNEITNIFLGWAACEDVKKISTMAYQR